MSEEPEGFDQTDDDDFDYSQLEPYEAVAEEQEGSKDEAIARLTKQQRKLAERQAKMEAQAAREKLVADFYAKASDEAKEFADVLLAGVSEPDKVKKMLELAGAKAAQVTGSATPAQAEAVEDDEVERAFAPPVQTSAPDVKDVGKETAEKTRGGDVHAAFLEFLAAPEKKGTIETK